MITLAGCEGAGGGGDGGAGNAGGGGDGGGGGPNSGGGPNNGGGPNSGGGGTSTTTSLTIDTSGFEPAPCAQIGRDRLTGLVLTPAADYLELHRTSDFGETGIVQTSGAPCATAGDVPACQAAIAAAAMENGFRLGECFDLCHSHALLVNDGDSVALLETKGEVLALLGPIDSPADALLAVELDEYAVQCGDVTRTGVREVEGGYEVIALRTIEICSPIVEERYRLRVTTAGEISQIEADIFSVDGACIGRRPAGLAAWRSRDRRVVGAHFANIAYLEAASVDAFDALRRDLVSHGAPARLVRAAVRARRDEVRHARVTAQLARRYGAAAPPRPVVQPAAPRSLEEVAIENAVEGCTKETFGALVGAWQARSATDPVVRRVMARVAADETRHAALSWAIHRWARAALPEPSRRRVEDARRAALADLSTSHERAHPALVKAAGLPDAAAHRALAERFHAAFSA